MHLQSFGAALTVTGSMHLLTLQAKGGKRQVLVDCGLFQGNNEQEARNYEHFDFDVAGLDAVILTHAHLDHVGRLPRLVKMGYRGPVYCTAPTQRLAEIVLRDSAKLQEEGYKRDLRRARRQGREHELPEPLYDERDVERALALLRPVLEFGKTERIAGLPVTAERAGHILGSAYLVLECADGRLLMSGDLGNRESGLQPDFTPAPQVDAVVIESTYANRTHRNWPATLAEFTQVLQDAAERGGKILVPSFAIERAQILLHTIKTLMESGEVPRMPIFLDSPMAMRSTDAYFEYGEELVPTVRESIERGEDPFRTNMTHDVPSASESRRINKYDGPAIIMAGNGMMTGGRIQHHLKHHLWKPNTSLVIASYQSPHSLGGRIVAGAEHVRIMGEEIKVQAKVHTIGGFSAHADQDDLLAFLQGTGNAVQKPHVWLVHGEEPVMQEFVPVLEAAGYKAALVPDAQEVSLLGS